MPLLLVAFVTGGITSAVVTRSRTSRTASALINGETLFGILSMPCDKRYTIHDTHAAQGSPGRTYVPHRHGEAPDEEIAGSCCCRTDVIIPMFVRRYPLSS